MVTIDARRRIDRPRDVRRPTDQAGRQAANLQFGHKLHEIASHMASDQYRTLNTTKKAEL
jgi:hypothetical protein